MGLMSVQEQPMIERDEETFFRIVQTTPDVKESIDMLRRAREWILKKKSAAAAAGKHTEAARWDATISRLNDEIKYQHEINENANLRKAVLAVVGRDTWEKIVTYKAQMLDEKRSERK